MKQMFFSRLSNLQLSTFSTNFLEIIAKSNANGVTSGKLYEELLTQDGLLSEAVNRTRFSELTQQLNSIGAERKKTITGMKGILYNLTKSPVKTESEAASLLYSAFSDMGPALIREVQNKQTGAIKSLLNTLAKTEYADAVTKTNMVNWISHLDSLQSSFITTNNLRNSHQRTINQSQSATSIRPGLADAVNKYYAWVYGQALSLEQDTWTTLNADLRYCYTKAIQDATSKTTESTSTSGSDNTSSTTTNTSKQPE